MKKGAPPKQRARSGSPQSSRSLQGAGQVAPRGLLGERPGPGLDPSRLGELGRPVDVHPDQVDGRVLRRQTAHDQLALLVSVAIAGLIGFGRRKK